MDMLKVITPRCVQFDIDTHSTASAIVQSSHSVGWSSLWNQTHKYILTIKHSDVRDMAVERTRMVLQDCFAIRFGCAVQ